ncbi:MAG: hypothetical protein AABW71_00680 [Nanoarchaeota archaeon]
MNKFPQIILIIFSIIFALILITSGKEAEFFDIFGFIGFVFLFITGIYMVKTKKRMPDWMGFLILLIGLVGLIVDGYVVFKNYLF